MKKLILIPTGYACTIEECPPGLFLCGKMVGLKSEYRAANGECEAFCDSGEFFANNNKNLVIPLEAKWENEE